VLARESEQKRSLLAEIDTIERRATSLAGEARHAADPGLRMSLKVRAKALEGLALDRRTVLSLPTPPPDVASVVQDASAPKAAPVPSPVVVAGIGLLMGLAGAVAITGIGASLDERPRDVDQLAAAAGVPVLASVPTMHFMGRRRGRLDTLRAPESGAAAAFRTLANLLAARHRDHEVLMVTSADPGEGSSTVAANLAVAMADRGVGVVLVDCDPRHPSVHRLFQVPSTPGLIHVLAGTAELDDVLSSSGVAGLTTLPAGRRTSRSGEALASPRLRQIVRGIARSVDLVILDGPAVRVGYDAMSVALASDTVLLVADALVGDVDQIAASCEQLRGMGAKLVGAVLNHSRASSGMVSLGTNKAASSAYRSR
jgi:capsular exopolysaccharide synthesis family protein